jgi:hypothetical protein
VIINLTLVISIMLCPALFAQTATPTPGPCDSCPDPGSLSCQLWPEVCYQCWADCGQPLSTPTPTRTNTPTATPTPTVTPTPTGPECILHMIGPGRVFLVAIYSHEKNGARYTYEVYPKDVPIGHYRGDPSDVEGEPVGYEWWDANGTRLLKSCGDAGRVFPMIFSDGFETGDTSRW